MGKKSKLNNKLTAVIQNMKNIVYEKMLFNFSENFSYNSHNVIGRLNKEIKGLEDSISNQKAKLNIQTRNKGFFKAYRKYYNVLLTSETLSAICIFLFMPLFYSLVFKDTSGWWMFLLVSVFFVSKLLKYAIFKVYDYFLDDLKTAVNQMIE